MDCLRVNPRDRNTPGGLSIVASNYLHKLGELTYNGRSCALECPARPTSLDQFGPAFAEG